MFEQGTWDRLRPIAPLFYIGIFFDVAALGLALLIGTSWTDHSLNIMFVLLGMGLSIPVGLLMTPLNDPETLAFREVSKALLTFASGYLLSKLDNSIATLLSPPCLLTPVVGFRVLAFLLCFGVGVPAMYAARREFAPA